MSLLKISSNGSNGLEHCAVLKEAFGINKYDTDFQNIIDASEPTVMGTLANIGVSWGVSSLAGKVKFMIDTCKITQDGSETAISLIHKSCYLENAFVKNMNEDKAVLVDGTSKFQYLAFGFSDYKMATGSQVAIGLSCKFT